MDIAETTKRRDLASRPVPVLARLPRPVYARAEQMQRKAATVAHAHDWVQFSYASRGVLQVQTHQGLFIAPPQWAILIPPHCVHSVVNAPHTEIRSLYIETGAMPDLGTDCVVLEVSDLLREMIRHFATLPVEYALEGAEGRFVQALLDQIHAAPPAALRLPWPEDERLRAWCHHLLDVPEAPLQLGVWSQALGVSERTLGRLFQKQTQMSFRQWRQRARLLAALPQLQDQQSVTEVALACGYDSTSAFIAAFRQLFGRTPGQFLRARAAATSLS
ncbi:AraC family transcriptional regulator [Comamonas aquatica]|uniref:AraC family transcriptional regulator n=1 Tax=Comamonas aquatica TaxID=225991 RepID=UPI002447CDAF|nr:helix-turn-helix transcriptional regulator [Comamonas aquatica]MDH0202658.1 helix-turn-helix transcriptional regulator [Comamonas aquatica]MDH0900187.1 helix-turn-helix transcriptional regulator [Comamonas aquatica]MDH1380485.1 helix-turn-helix transcriptional regulator [Comamonas aquatica]MDH1447759.1 helix-turn-helix transcriptional regulator [Comamonas aquatica]MDH1639785.1 helix-turn-helix transcriptional regulator [Comamonas aquatica]